MKYCADTWFILKFSSNDQKAADLIKNVRFGKDELIIPMSVVAESFKTLFARGISENKIETMFDELQIIEKVSFVGLDRLIAKEASKVSFSHGTPMLDSFVASTYKLLKCHFVLTDDSDLKKLHKAGYLKIKNW